MELSAPVRLLLSRVNHGTVYDLIQGEEITEDLDPSNLLG